MKPQQFEQLIEKAKVVSDEEFSVTMESKHCNYEFDIYAETGNDFKVFVNQFGKNTKQGWIEFEPTEEQINTLQELINENLPSQNSNQEYENLYEKYGVSRENFF